MDWLTFKFCVLIWVLCVSTSKSQPELLNSTSSNQLQSACQDGQPIVAPDQCNTCICFSGQIYCTNIACPEQDCVNGVDLPQPDACNKCICRRGTVTCSNMICIPAPNCTEKQLYPAQNKCIACMCLNGFITCTSNPCAEEALPSTTPTTTTKKPMKKKCIEGASLPEPNECIECICQNGRKKCKYICNLIVENRFSQGPECSADQPVYRPDERNECNCFEGRLECSDLLCIRGSKCVKGQVIPKPDSCNACTCIEGHIICTNFQCPIPKSRNPLRPESSSTEARTLDECQEGDIISPPPPPNDCNTCYCIHNRIVCTMNSCEGSDPEIKGRIREPNEKTDIEVFDKQISVKPFINMLSKKYENFPTKLMHTPAFNGFHQEIKVHASHLPKNVPKLLKVLANSLDNAALDSISQRLLTSSNSLSDNHDLKIPLDHQVVQTYSLGGENLLTSQSSKLITSGSLSNESILVIPKTKSFDGQNSQSVLPLTSKHETIWKSVSSPVSLLFNNNQKINPHSSQQEKLNVYYYDNPPSMFTSIDQNNVIRNPSKFSHPGLHMLPTKPPRNTVEKLNTNTQSQASNPKSININDGEMSYAPFPQENKQFEPIPSVFVSKHDEMPHLLRPYQQNFPAQNQIFNYTLSTLMFRPGKLIATPINNDGQQKPSQSHFIPNLSKYYLNHDKPQQIQFKLNDNNLSMSNNKGIQHPPLFPNNPNQPIVAANKYKQSRLGLKPGQGNVSPLNNKGAQTDQYFIAFSPDFHINPPLIKPGQQQSYTLKIHPTVTEMNEYDQHDSWNLTNNQFDTYPHSLNDGENTGQIKSYQNRTNPTIPMYPYIFANYPHSSSQSQLIPSQDNLKKGGLKDPKSTVGPQSLSNSAEDPIRPKSNEHLPPPSQTRPTQNKHPSGVFDDRGSANGFQYAHNAYEDPRPLKPVYKLLSSKLEMPQNHHIPGFFDERGSPDGFQHPSNSAKKPLYQKKYIRKPPNSPFSPTTYKQLPGMYPSISAGSPTHPKNLTHPEQNKQKPHSQVGPNHNKPTPGIFDFRGSPNGFQYSANSPENPLHNLHYSPQSQFGPPQNQHLPGVFRNPGSLGGFQYPSNSVGNRIHLKDNLHNPPQSQFLPSHYQYTSGVFDYSGSADGFQYPYNSVDNPRHSKQNKQIQHNSPTDPTQNQQLPAMFDERDSADGFQYPSNSVENPTQPKDNQHKLPQSQFLPSVQHVPGLFDERGSADGFQYPSHSYTSKNPTHPNNNPNTTPESQIKLPQNHLKPSSLDDGYNNNNPLRPWMHLDHEQYKPSFFDNLLNGVHNIPWLFSGDQNKDSEIVTFAPKPRFIPNYGQYKPSYFDNLFNRIHQIPWSVPNQDNNALGSDAEITTPRSGFILKQDQYRPSMVNHPSLTNQNVNTDLSDVDDNQLQIEQDVSTPSTDLTDSVGIKNNLLPELKPDSDPDSLIPTDDGIIPDNYDQLYPLFKAVKKLSDPHSDDSVLSVGSMDQLDLLSFLFPGITKILNYVPQDQDDISPVEKHDVQKINPLSKLKSKLKQSPESDNGILNWLKSKLNKLVPTEDNAIVTKNYIDKTTLLNLLSKLTQHNLKNTAAPQNIHFSGFDPESIENIMSDFKEDTFTTTLTPRTASTHSYENRFSSVPTIPEKSRIKALQLKYPDVHIHQPNDGPDVDLLPYVETDGEINLATNSEELSASMFPKMFHPRFRHKPKDQKEECGHGTQWISNCHGCSCYFGQAMCFRLPDCELRPLGEPMTCKPYSHFKMACYTCECNGDGVAECDATHCNTEPSGQSRGSTEPLLPMFNEFFDSKKTNEILQNYNFYKKLPKDCAKQELQTLYPTCERGTSWVSNCLKCKCNERGKHECIKIDDCELDVASYGKPGQCKPNSKFYSKTNSMPCVECSCNDEGISYCPAADYKKQ